MVGAYKQVTLTYLTRPAVCFVAPIILGVVALAVWKAPTHGMMQGNFLLLMLPLAAIMVILGITVGSQLKTQFATPAVYLTPGYARAHRGVVFGVYAVACLGPSALLAWRWQVSTPHVMGGATTAFVLAVAWATGVSRVLSVIFWLMLLLPFAHSGEALLSGDYQADALDWVWLFAGIVALGAVLLRLTTLRGEIDRTPDVSGAEPRNPWVIPALSRWSGRAARRLPVSKICHAEESWLWRLGASPHDPLKLTVAVCAGAIVVEVLLWATHIFKGYLNPVTLGLIFATGFLPPLAATMYVAQRWPRLGVELLRPLPRQKVMSLLIGGVIRDVLTLWACVAGAALISMHMVILFHTDLQMWARSANYIVSICTLGAIGFLGTSLVLLFAPRRSFLLSAVLSIGVPVAGVAVFMRDAVNMQMMGHALAPLGIAAVALALLPLAYYRWCRADL